MTNDAGAKFLSCARGRRRKLFYRVIAAGMKRVAAQDAPRSHPGAAQRAVTLDGLARILRTGWDETTGRGKQRRDGCLV